MNNLRSIDAAARGAIRVIVALLLSVLLNSAFYAAHGQQVSKQPSGQRANASADIASLAARSDSGGIARKVQAACGGAAEKVQCYESLLVPLAKEGKVKLAMGSLDRLAALEPEVKREGHVYAHAIGIAAGQTTANVAGAFTQCSEAFQSGCYHGVIQAYFSGLDSVNATEANKLCEPFRGSEAERWIRYQCVHGMGHGLTMLHSHDLTKGLAGCDLLRDGWDRHSCYSGAFMENIVNVTIPHHPASKLGAGDHASHDASSSKDEHAGHDMGGAAVTKFQAVDPANPQYPCSIVAERFLRACYEMQTSVMLYNNKGNIGAAAKDCDSAPKAMRTVCYASLGRDISSYSQQSHAEGIRLCSLGTPKYQPWCYFGLVKNLIDLNARADDGISFCRSVRGAPNKSICYAAVGEQILILAPAEDARRRLCAPSEADFVEACHYGARLLPSPPAALAQVWKAAEM